MMDTVLLSRRFISEYARRPVNLALLLIVPLIFVTLAAGALGDFAAIVGGVADSSLIAAPTAGWAAAFLAGVAGFFHVLGSRGADRRLSMAGMGSGRLIAGRLVSGLILTLVAAGAALAALALRSGVPDPSRAIIGTIMFGVIYFGIGVTIGAVIQSEVNGSLIVIFFWMLDVFLGPAMAGADVWITRLFPSHYVTLLMLDAASGHSGPAGDLGWAVVWMAGSLIVAATVFSASTSRQSKRCTRHHGWAGLRRLFTGLRYGLRDYRRNIGLWVLLVLLPVFFISLSFAVTPDNLTPIEVFENSVASTKIVSMIEVHGAIMVPITIGFLTGLAGMFVVQGSLEADARLAISGYRTVEILAARIGVIALSALIITVVSLAITAVDFSPVAWGWFAFGNLLVAITYAMVGVLVGVVFGRLGGLYLMFLLPFVDIGLAQNVMFSAAPPNWGIFLPGRGAVRLLVDAAFTASFDQPGSFALSLGWIVALAIACAAIFSKIAKPRQA